MAMIHVTNITSEVHFKRSNFDFTWENSIFPYDITIGKIGVLIGNCISYGKFEVPMEKYVAMEIILKELFS